MNRIRLLPEQVANQIAAGEVVERPASVVKELVENALDAHSSKITVDIQAGGRSLIRVTDDGTGMNRDDALLCLERHATSKIQSAEDLFAIHTMGFRGEAIASIASVSRFTLTTRERDSSDAAATQLILNGGKLLEVKAAGGPSGTSVEVRQLFFNLPARRKFLRSEETEYSHIHHYLTLAALAYPEIAFTLTKDGRIIWQLPAAATATKPADRLSSLAERIRTLSGRNDEWLPVQVSSSIEEPPPSGEDAPDPDASSGPASLHLWGFIGKPGLSRATRQDQHLFVNRRPVESRGLNHALLEGYHTVLMKGRYPVCTLFLELDPASVDVNIHPAKREVKFHNERSVRQFVAQAVRQSLLDYHTTSTVAPSRSALPDTPFAPVPKPAPPEQPPHTTDDLPQLVQTKPSDRSHPTPGSTERSMPAASDPPAPSPATRSISALAVARIASASPLSPSPAQSPGDPTPLLGVPLRLVGVIGKLYVVLESDRGLVLLDQHAAHERILFEQMLHRLEAQGEAPSQRLLLPETVELSAPDSQFLREQLPTLSRLGVGLSEFGERTFLLDAVPPLVKLPDARRFALELVDELKAAGEAVNSLRLGEHTIAKTVCRHAVKANDPLAGPELENLVTDLRLCAMPYTCPHGRPTLIEMNYRELEKKFGRQA